jgi:diguanylate cyclase
MKQQDIAAHDPLTRLLNRSAYDSKLFEFFTAWKDRRQDIFLILGDVDHFKKINDAYGHAAGDQVLKILGRIFTMYSQENDVVARYGGEEFVVLIADRNESEVLAQAEKIRQAIEEWQFRHSNQAVKVTVSFGIAQLSEGDTMESLFERADKALYEAKKKGRNQTLLV